MAVLGGGGRMRAVPLGPSVGPFLWLTVWVKRREQRLCWAVADACGRWSPVMGLPSAVLGG
eukprot:2601133-Pyramimonas_sp.AAC.1